MSSPGTSEQQTRPAPALIDEARAIDEATGNRAVLRTSPVVAAWGGREARTLELLAAAVQDAPPGRRRAAAHLAEYPRAVLYNGLARYEVALTAARRACEHEALGVYTWALTELIEAGARCGQIDAATAALRCLEDRTPAAGTDWALGLLARSRALLSDRPEADGLYREALDRLTASRITLHLARTQLVYGEWLRRAGRRVDARRQLHAAHRVFGRAGADGFAERAHRELLATGETVRKRTAGGTRVLTAQEAEVARLASIGDTNPEIAAQLYLSPRTVEWHLRKVFSKLGISSRRQLGARMPDAVPV